MVEGTVPAWLLHRTGIAPEDVVLFLGCGTISLLAAKMAQAAGAVRVLVTGINRDDQVRLHRRGSWASIMP